MTEDRITRKDLETIKKWYRPVEPSHPVSGAPRYELHLVNTTEMPKAIAARLADAYARSAHDDDPLYEVVDTVARRPVAWARRADAARIMELYNRTDVL